jgi:hypothetical protein
MNSIKDFEAYVNTFYNSKDGVYPIKGLTSLMITLAVQKHIKKVGWWFAGDSFDREQVREIILTDFARIN